VVIQGAVGARQRIRWLAERKRGRGATGRLQACVCGGREIGRRCPASAAGWCRYMTTRLLHAPKNKSAANTYPSPQQDAAEPLETPDRPLLRAPAAHPRCCPATTARPIECSAAERQRTRLTGMCVVSRLSAKLRSSPLSTKPWTRVCAADRWDCGRRGQEMVGAARRAVSGAQQALRRTGRASNCTDTPGITSIAGLSHRCSPRWVV